MSWASQDFWVLTGQCQKDGRTVYIPANRTGLEKPHRFRLIDIFKVDPPTSGDVEAFYEKSLRDAGYDPVERVDADGRVEKTYPLSLKFVHSTVHKTKTTRTRLTFKVPFTVTSKIMARRVKEKRSRMHKEWAAYRETPDLKYDPDTERFSLTLPPNSRAYVYKDSYWSVFGFANSELLNPDEMDDDNPPEDDPDTIYTDDDDVEDGDDEAAAEEEEEVYDPNSTVPQGDPSGGQQQQADPADQLEDPSGGRDPPDASGGQDPAKDPSGEQLLLMPLLPELPDQLGTPTKNLFKPPGPGSRTPRINEGVATFERDPPTTSTPTNRNVEDIRRRLRPRQKRSTTEDDPFAAFREIRVKRGRRSHVPIKGFVNKTGRTITIQGARRESDKIIAEYARAADREALNALAQASYFIEPLENEEMNATGVVTEPFNYGQVYRVFKDMLAQALQLSNFSHDMVTIDTMPDEYTRFRFVYNAPVVGPMPAMNFSISLDARTALITGLPAEKTLLVDRKAPAFALVSKPIEQPEPSRHYEPEHQGFGFLPPTTAIILKNSAKANTVYSDSSSNTLLGYIKSDKALVSSDTFIFTGNTNFLTCEFYNEQARAPIDWTPSTIIKFIFKRVK